MNVLRRALLLAVSVSPLLVWPALSWAGPLGLFPLNKSRSADDSPPRSVYSRDKSSGQTPYQSVAGKSKKPGMLQRMGQGTRNLVGSTKDALTFKKKSAPSPVSGKTKSWNPKQAKQKKESSSWFSSWFKPKEPEKPQTMKQWMQQDRVDY